MCFIMRYQKRWLTGVSKPKIGSLKEEDCTSTISEPILENTAWQEEKGSEDAGNK